MELHKKTVILVFSIFLSLEKISALNNTEKFQIVVPEKPTEQTISPTQNKTIDKLVQEQTDLIKKIISSHKPTTVDYPVVTKKEAEIKDTKIKEEKERESIEELSRRCQELFKVSNKNNTQKFEVRSETKESINRIPTVESFGPNKKPEFLQQTNVEIVQPKLPPEFSHPSQVEQMTKKYFIVTRNRTVTNDNQTVNTQEAYSDVPKPQNLISQAYNIQQHPANLKYMQLEPVILQKMILNNGKMLLYWYKSIPVIPQFVSVPKYQSRISDVPTYPTFKYPSQTSNIQTYPSLVPHQTQISHTQTYPSQISYSQPYPAESVNVPKSQISNPRSQISNTQSQMFNLQSQISNTQSQILNPESQVLNTQSQISNSQSQVSKPQSQVLNSQLQVSNSQLQVSNPQSQVSHTQSQTSNSQSQILNRQSQVSNTQSQISNSQSQVSKPMSQVLNSQSQPSNSHSQISNTQSQASNTQSQLSYLPLQISNFPPQFPNTQKYSSQFAQNYKSQASNTQKLKTQAIHPHSTIPTPPDQVPNYEIEYGATQKSDDNLYTKQLKFIIPMPYPPGGAEAEAVTRYPWQFDPYAYYPKPLQPSVINVPVPYVPTFHMIRTLRLPENLIKTEKDFESN